MNISQNAKKNSAIIFWAILTFVLGMFAMSVVFNVSNSSIGSARDARIQADIAQIRALAKENYQKEENYSNISCDSGDIKTLCDDITIQSGVKPVVLKNENEDKFCVIAKLKKPNKYWCTDGVYTGKGFCNEKTLVCSENEVINPSIFPMSVQRKIMLEKFSVNYILGLITLGLFIFSLVMLFKKSKFIAISILIIFIFIILFVLTSLASV